MYIKFLSRRTSLTTQKFKLLNFLGFLMNSYLHKTKIELESKSVCHSGYDYSKLFNKLHEKWLQNYLDQLRMQVEQLMNSCYNSMNNEMSFSHVS